MPKFYSKTNVSVEFRVVRAFLTSQEVQQETGIIANFSAKTVLVDGKKETALMSHNSLMLTVNREGHLFVSSKYEQPPKRVNGKSILGNKIFFFSLMPGSDQDDTSLNVYDKFVTTLAQEIQEFVQKARARSEEKKKEPRVMPEGIDGLLALSPKGQAKKSEGDIPF